MNGVENKSIKYENYIVAFIDILGFSAKVISSSVDHEKIIQINKTLSKFNDLRKKSTWSQNNNLMQVEEDAQKKHLGDYYIDQMARCFCFSDSIIITVKADQCIEERASALIAMIARLGMELLSEGTLIRGGISFGKMFVDDNRQSIKSFGPAVVEAYKLEEDQARYPRIVIGQSLIKHLTYPLEAKHNRQPYHQYIKRFNDGMVGFTQLIFLQVMSNAPDIIRKFSFDKLLHQSKYVIIDGLDQNMFDTHIFEKYQWLKEEYNQLILSDEETKKNKKWKIQDVQKADSRGNIHFKYINDLYDCEG
jgi:hypothetical protein